MMKFKPPPTVVKDIEPVVDDTPLRLAYAAGDWKAYAKAAIALGVPFTDDLMETHIGQSAVDHWRVWAELLPWER